MIERRTFRPKPHQAHLALGLDALLLLLGAPGTALAGGDEEGQAPPSAGPPGPWEDREVGEGEDVPYRPTDARSCRLREVRRAGPGSVLGLWVVRTPCPTATRVVRRYQRCLNTETGRNRRCYTRVDTRCVRPVFLGRCWMRDRFFRRHVMGYRCSERRLYEVDGIYEGHVICRQGRRRISHGYTLSPTTRGRGRQRIRAAGGVGEPARDGDRRHRRHLSASVRAR